MDLDTKLDRQHTLSQMKSYLEEWLPELSQWKGETAIDLGTGAGVFLESCLSAGLHPVGVESLSGFGGMGEDYLDRCEEIHKQYGISKYVVYADALEWITSRSGRSERSSFQIINSRGSLEQIFDRCMDGMPHHLHHNASAMEWREKPSTVIHLTRFIGSCSFLLKTGGVLLISANGSKNHQWLENQLCSLTELFSLKILKTTGCTYKWMKISPTS